MLTVRGAFKKFDMTDRNKWFYNQFDGMLQKWDR